MAKKPEEYITRSELLQVLKDGDVPGAEQTVDGIFLIVQLRRVLGSLVDITKVQ